MHKALRRLCKKSIEIHPFVKRSGTGEVVYGAPYSVKAYIESNIQLVRNATGVEVISNQFIVIDGMYDTVSVKDLIKLPDNTSPSIINILKLYDRLGEVDHLEIYL